MLLAVGVAAVPVWAYITGAETAVKNKTDANEQTNFFIANLLFVFFFGEEPRLP